MPLPVIPGHDRESMDPRMREDDRIDKPMPPITSPLHKQLASILQNEPQLDFAVLVGSQATGTAQPHSDWDIALQWAYGADWLATLGSTETLRHKLAAATGLSPAKIDLIDLRRANLAMRASVAEEGLPLSGEDSLAWARFLQRTWRDLEDFYWDKQHAA